MRKNIISLILIVSILASTMVSTTFAADNAIDNIIQKGKNIVNNIVDSVKGSNGGALSDISDNWAKPYINQLISLGAIKGKSDGLFHPNDTITRAEFTKILLISMGGDPGQPSIGYWATNYLLSATNRGLIKTGEFINPEQNISRMEITKMVVRALGKETEATDRAGQSTKFSDDIMISTANKGYIIVCRAYGIINGYADGTFKPNGYATREEATKMIITYLNNRSNNVDIPVNENADSNDVVINKQTVTTSHPEILPHIKKGMEILSEEGYVTKDYYPDDNQVYFSLFNKREDSLGERWEIKPILLSYYFETEKDKRADVYYPYNIILYQSDNTMARDKFLKIINDVFPEGKELVTNALNNKLADINYSYVYYKPINGRNAGISTSKGSKQISVILGLQNP